MSSWQPFGYEGKPETCLWCGRKLHYQKTRTWGTVEVNGGFTSKITGEKRAELPGYYEDGFFCGLSCGYKFGVRLAQLDKRLQAPPEENQEGELKKNHAAYRESQAGARRYRGERPEERR